jgi:hypothetical protein
MLAGRVKQVGSSLKFAVQAIKLMVLLVSYPFLITIYMITLQSCGEEAFVDEDA